MMTKEQQKNVLDGIQAALEEMQDSDIDFLFLASMNFRGTIHGSTETLSIMLAYDMVKYEPFCEIVHGAMKLYNEHKDEIREIANTSKPSHEIVKFD